MSHFFPHMIPPQPSYAVSTVLLGASMNISSRRRALYRRNPHAHRCRIFQPHPGLLLPHLSVENHRRGGTGRLQHDPSHLRRLLRPLCRIHPDSHLPLCGRQRPAGKSHLPNRTPDLPVHVPGFGGGHLPVRPIPGGARPSGAPLRPTAADHGFLCALRRRPRLHQRLLLRPAADKGSPHSPSWRSRRCASAPCFSSRTS